MKKFTFKTIIFILLPFLVSGIFKDSVMKDFVFSFVLALEFLILSLFVLIKREELIEKIKHTNKEYMKDRLAIPLL